MINNLITACIFEIVIHAAQICVQVTYYICTYTTLNKLCFFYQVHHQFTRKYCFQQKTFNTIEGKNSRQVAMCGFITVLC